jgi:hypothetical protein
MPQIPDPEWVDPEDGSEAPLIDEWTAMEWAKLVLRSFLSRTVGRWENKVENDAVVIPLDPDIAT